jgi:hypothetical protein
MYEDINGFNILNYEVENKTKDEVKEIKNLMVMKCKICEKEFKQNLEEHESTCTNFTKKLNDLENEKKQDPNITINCGMCRMPMNITRLDSHEFRCQQLFKSKTHINETNFLLKQHCLFNKEEVSEKTTKFIRIEKNSDEWNAVASYFNYSERVRNNMEIVNITKAVNPKAFIVYEDHKEEFIKKFGEDNAEEDYLFNFAGNYEEKYKLTMKGICEEGFKYDKTKNMFNGKGFYFSEFADRAVSFSNVFDFHSNNFVILSEVFLGNTKVLYDADKSFNYYSLIKSNLKNRSVFIKYQEWDNIFITYQEAQAIPLYIIEYVCLTQQFMPQYYSLPINNLLENKYK